MSYADLISNLISENKTLTQANERLKAENEKLQAALEEIKKAFTVAAVNAKAKD